MVQLIGKGKQNHFKKVPYIVAWIDLLGYGQMLRDCNYDPTSKKAAEAVHRLEVFHEISLKHSCPAFQFFQINDGIVAWRELSIRTSSVTEDFIKRSIDFFNDVSETEKKLGFPGPRMVIATGISMKMKTNYAAIAKKRAEALIESVNNGEIAVEEAIYKASSLKSYCNAVEVLQANFAFSRAVKAEESGTKGGLPGNNIYIDMNIFKTSKIKCLDLDAPFLWDKEKGLETHFSRIIGYSEKQFNKYRENEISSTIDISKKLLNLNKEKKVINRLKK